MSLNRETIFQALHDRLRGGISELVFSSRAQLQYSDLAQVEQPAMTVVDLGGKANRQSALPARWFMQAFVTLFVRTSDGKSSTAETLLHAMLSEAETALGKVAGEQPPDDYDTTLGGLVFYAHITSYRIHHGVGTQQAAMTLTIEMLSIPQ